MLTIDEKSGSREMWKFKGGHTKGQLISKCLFGVSNVPKNQTWKLKFFP